MFLTFGFLRLHGCTRFILSQRDARDDAERRFACYGPAGAFWRITPEKNISGALKSNTSRPSDLPAQTPSATVESGGVAHRDFFNGFLAGQQALHVRWY
jgi:hypothetical protein